MATHKAWRVQLKERIEKDEDADLAPFSAPRDWRYAWAVAEQQRLRARACHAQVREAWAEYQLDLETFQSAPALADITVEATAYFVRAMARAQDLEQGADAVDALESAWEQAHAHWIGDDYLPDDRFARLKPILAGRIRDRASQCG